MINDQMYRYDAFSLVQSLLNLLTLNLVLQIIAIMKKAIQHLH